MLCWSGDSSYKIHCENIKYAHVHSVLSFEKCNWRPEHHFPLFRNFCPSLQPKAKQGGGMSFQATLIIWNLRWWPWWWQKCQDTSADYVQSLNVASLSFFSSQNLRACVDIHGGFCLIIREERGGVFCWIKYQWEREVSWIALFLYGLEAYKLPCP